jgi:hypothetical protein
VSHRASLAFALSDTAGGILFGLVLVGLLIVWVLIRALARSVSTNTRIVADAARSSMTGIGAFVLIGVILVLVVAVLFGG